MHIHINWSASIYLDIRRELSGALPHPYNPSRSIQASRHDELCGACRCRLRGAHGTHYQQLLWWRVDMAQPHPSDQLLCRRFESGEDSTHGTGHHRDTLHVLVQQASSTSSTARTRTRLFGCQQTGCNPDYYWGPLSVSALHFYLPYPLCILFYFFLSSM